MIWTIYNYLFYSDKFGGLLYNSLTNSFISLSDEAFEKTKILKDNPNNYLDYNEDLIKLLIKIGALYEGEHKDIENLIKLDFYKNIFSERKINLVITPTLDCNFRCKYCYEQGNIKQIYMNEEMENILLDFIIKLFSHNKAEEVLIEWYGGEPLLAFSTIKSITQKLLKNSCNFYAGIVTNGYLLNDKVISELEYLRIKSIQITIDGNEQTHNLRRPHFKYDNSYEKIIQNLTLLHKHKVSDSIYVDIRINIDNSNKELYNKTYKELKKKFPKFHIYPGIIINDDNSCISDKNCALDNSEKNDFFVKEYEVNKNSNIQYYPEWFGIATCNATRHSDFVIGPLGETYSCWRDVGDDKWVIGNIKDNLFENKKLFAKYVVGIDPFEDKKCKKCFYLPICGGGCPRSRMLNKYFGYNLETCIDLKGKKNLKKFLEIHYELKMKKEQFNLY